MAPPGAHSTPSTSTPLFISVVIVISSVVVTSSVLLIIVLVILLRRRNAYASTERNTLATHEHVPKLVITDTSMLPASSVVVKDSDDLDKVIASFKPLRQESAEPDERYRSERPPRKRKRKLDETKRTELTTTSTSTADVCPAKQGSGTDWDKSPSLSEASEATFDGSGSFKTPGIWWYEFHGSDLSFASTSSGGSDVLPATPDSKTSMPLDTVQIDSSLSFDRDILEYCWRLSDKVAPLAPPALCYTSEVHAERTFCVTPETMVSMTPLKSTVSLDKKILEYCWKITDYGSSGNLREELDEDPVTLKFTSAAKSVSEASVHDLQDILCHDSGQIVIRCSKSRLASARYSTAS